MILTTDKERRWSGLSNQTRVASSTKSPRRPSNPCLPRYSPNSRFESACEGERTTANTGWLGQARTFGPFPDRAPYRSFSTSSASPSRLCTTPPVRWLKWPVGEETVIRTLCRRKDVYFENSCAGVGSVARDYQSYSVLCHCHIPQQFNSP